ncbi:penicillin-binding protein 2 [Agreia sp. COWG]|uniref:peptidoglycan D,D-transpeptidase FtsI family protein n=1 Tax=Agreia sp. COWG TaxID=2773266 RepID=UPI001926B05F|nr:penicillin-binding protein 2 [Agreia sp. COWG]CAD5989175.1 Penicillin-binding protein A [Agreia sp. COWG]
MNKELKRVAVVVLIMFGTLFVATTSIQFFQTDALAADSRNTRALYASYDAERGPILVDGQPVAMSVPSDDDYKFQRTYPQGELYSQVTGYYTLGQGSTGIENSLGDYLSGTADSQFLARINSIITGQKPKGASVELTIDPVVQQAAWDALGDLKGSVVAIEPSSGRILAMVSKPTFDPNTLAVHDGDAVDNTYQSLIDAPGDPLVNRSIDGNLYPPGSTFKIVTSSAALQNGTAATDTQPNLARFPLPGSNNTVSNAGGGTCGSGDTVSLETAFVLSCNIPMAEFGVQMGDTKLVDMAKAFGFQKQLSIPMEVQPSTIRSPMTDDKLALSSFGQDEDRVTPLQVAMFSAAVANKGTIMKPNLVESITAPDLSVLQQFTPEKFEEPITSTTSSTLSTFMVAAVQNGAASNARIDGVSVAGKTGTAENGEGDPYTLWFTGFAPADNPRVAIAVVVEDGGGKDQSGSGNSIAAPIAKQVLEAVLSK